MNKLAAVAIILAGMPLSAMAAPFCLSIQGLSPQCIYVDGNECQAQAARQNGACVPDPTGRALPVSRVGEYCMILPAGDTHCGYSDPNSCSRDALRQHGVCTKSAGPVPQQLPNDFVPNAGR